MADYNKIKQANEHLQFVGGAIHKDCIYLITENYYEPKIHGKKYNVWNYPEKLIINMYIPKHRKKSDEWCGEIYSGIKSLYPATCLKDVDFCSYLTDDSFVSQKVAKNGTNGVVWTENVIELGKRVVMNMAVIDGIAYVCTTGGAIYRRISDNNWEEITNKQTEKYFSESEKKSYFNNGFSVIGGFSANEIYTADEKGNFYSNKNGMWEKIEIPSSNKSEITEIICSDGNVFINNEDRIIKGRNDQWEIIIKDEISNIVKQITCFQGELYFLDDAELKRLRNGELENIEFPATIHFGFSMSSKTMVTSEDLLMIMDSDRVVLFDGNHWFNLFDKNKTEEELREKGTFYDPREK
ncbi:hypothetical protein QJU89_07535 [Pasteurella skyensis]|uniref:Uncharacterized protein n=1 Tax=Phocoenobacter skyensis TaxID=97481 RepID=A0AAJ6N9Z2_9PAST|nr:hypothetical protein [Pasteurella skyensis]MDP8162932.1 hypothetical protein [Pasteurella skyensis]MDP8172916.1 hypothetical protein [Pasteurella skyensis]MDP8176638.1 hypothetical protein [Pasteurella skyensis]MDP8179416.1 hypothetical protein [Pasteurella skyensis]MDP8183542.1 hypothetical protein [Pasteurella skyensis]